MKERPLSLVRNSLFAFAIVGIAIQCSDSGAPGPPSEKALDSAKTLPTPAGEYSADWLAERTVEEIWRIGVERFEWSLEGPSAEATKEDLIGRFLDTEAIRDWGDFGYPGDARYQGPPFPPARGYRDD
jgi:hypothetical protein